jgi:hypothetical protein
VFAASAIYGYTTSDSCRKAEARADELAAERRSRPPGWEPQQKSGPRVAAGFRFGMSEGAAERVCAGTGRTFRSGDGFHACDGAPPGVAQANSVELKFDTRGLWSIDVVLPASAQWKRSFVQLREGIVKRYGAPVRTNDEVPERCAPEAEAAGCAERGEIKVSTEWQWPDGGRLVLRIPPVPGPLAIRLLYTRPGSTPLQEPRENREPSPEPPIQRATTAP